jgi:hypothetical protein
MKLTKMMIAVAALAGATSTFAAPDPAAVVRMSGASALRGNFAISLNALCTTAGGVMQEWISGSNISTYVCTPAGGLTSGGTGTYSSTAAASFIPFDATSGFVEVRLNVAGGSFTALQVLNGGTDRYLDPGVGTTVAVGGPVNVGVAGGTLATEQGIGGFSDVNYEGFANNVLATVPGIDTAVSNNTSQQVGVAQGFGVAVSNALYGAMFTAQQTSGAIPAAPTCLVTITSDPRCVPSIGKGQMGAIMSNNNFSAAKTAGASFLASQLAANTELRYVRRVDTSGTQASAQNYFLGIGNMGTPLGVFTDPSDRTNAAAVAVTSGCNTGDVRGPLATDNEVDTAFVTSGQINLCDKKQGNLRVLAAPGTGDVRNELNKATILGGATNYAIGVMSLENDQATYKDLAGVSQPTTWKWLRVQKAQGADNAAPGANTNRAAMIAGEYDFYYETWSYTKADIDAKNDALMTAVIGQLTGGAALKGLVVNGTGTNQSPYTRGGRTDTPSSR